MRTRTFIFLAAMLLVLGQVGALGASPITGFNPNRPITPDPPAGGDLSVQDILNSMPFTSGLNAINDQQTAGVFQTVDVPPFANTSPVLRAEYAGAYNNADVFGIWTAYDTSGPITKVPIFYGSATPGATGLIKFTDANHIQLVSADAGVNTGIFAGIAYNFFGFYLENTDLQVTSFTYDALNPDGRAGALAYKGNQAWALFFEGNFASNEADYNDMVVRVESILPVVSVPLPASVVLLASGLFGLAGLGLRRKKR
jgi:hypothetical protein